MDLVVSPLDALADLGAVWENAGGIWGGRIGDPVHFEFPGFSPVDFGNQNVIVTLAQWFANLPWYVQIFLPTSLATSNEPAPAELAGAQSAQQILKILGL